MLPRTSIVALDTQVASLVVDKVRSHNEMMNGIFVTMDAAYTGEMDISLIREGITIPLENQSGAGITTFRFMPTAFIAVLKDDEFKVTMDTAGAGSVIFVSGPR